MDPRLEAILIQSAVDMERFAADMSGIDGAFANGRIRESIAAERGRAASELGGEGAEEPKSDSSGGEVEGHEPDSGLREGSEVASETDAGSPNGTNERG